MKRTNERGQAMVLTVLFLTAMLGMATLVLDLGAWFRTQRALQSAADAAALAGAQALPESPASASALANDYALKNGATDAVITFTTDRAPNDTISVKLKQDAPGFFAKVFGIDSVEVGAKATARTGGMAKARYAAPIAVDERHPLLNCRPQPCFGEETQLDLEKVGPGAFRLLNLDGSRGGTGPDILAEWILRGYDGYMPLGEYYSDPGAKFNSSHVKGAMDVRLGDELLFPVYRSVEGGGANVVYQVVAWVGFRVTGFTGKGNGGKVEGSFTQVIWEGIQSESGEPNPFGAYAIQLVD